MEWLLGFRVAGYLGAIRYIAGTPAVNMTNHRARSERWTTKGPVRVGYVSTQSTNKLVTAHDWSVQLETDDFRQVIRTMIQHEDTLRDQRLGWFLTLNGFLFAALGFAWNSSPALAYILGVLGVFIALSSFLTLRVSTLAVTKLRHYVDDSSASPPVVGLTSEDFKRASSKDPGARNTGRSDVAPRQSVTNDVAKPGPPEMSRVERYLVPKLYAWDVLPFGLGAAWVGVVIARLVS
jgi:hypothetical protein